MNRWSTMLTDFIGDLFASAHQRMSRRQAKRIVATFSKRSRWYPAALRRLAQ